jgi:uncharacterized protein with PIN domain
MAWKRIDTNNARESMEPDSNPPRFLIDAELGPELAPVLRRLGHNVIDVSALNVNCRSNDDVIATAWSERRILLTKDTRFLDDRRFPPNQYPGVIVLPPIHDPWLLKALISAVYVFHNRRQLSERAKVFVGCGGRFTVTQHNDDTGKREIMLFKLRKSGPPLIWVSHK